MTVLDNGKCKSLQATETCQGSFPSGSLVTMTWRQIFCKLFQPGQY